MNINTKLKEYIEKNILPEYEKNDLGHSIDHIDYVINRSFKFAEMVENEKINLNMVYTIAAYHDIGHHIDTKHHEKISAEILKEDKNLEQFFTKEQIEVMSEAVYDHRASSKHEPRSIYGKIVSSADRNTNIDIFLKRTYAYNITHYPDMKLEEIIETSRKHLIDKFGRKGYASKKMYFKDEDYIVFLNDIAILTDNIEKFKNKFLEVNNIKLI